MREDHELDDLDDELPDESDTDDSDSVDTEPCPFCRKPVYDRSDTCPSCGNFITHLDAPARKPLWFIAAVVICLIVMLVAWIF